MTEPQGLFSQEELLSMYADWLTWLKGKRASLVAQQERLRRRGEADEPLAQGMVTADAGVAASPVTPEAEVEPPPQKSEEEDPWL